jgi:PAS domain S-box-containing protein
MIQSQEQQRKNVDETRTILRRVKDRQSATISKEQYRIISYDDMPVPLCRIDMNGFIVDCNNLLAELFFGTSKEAVIEVSLFDLVESSSYSALNKLLATLVDSSDGKFADRIRFKCKSGAMVGALHVKPLRDAIGRIIGFNVAIVDETRNYSKLERIEKDKEELQRKEILKDEFIAVASHELRTPIQPILGFALLAKRKLISEEKAWDGILAEARRLQQLSNDILDVSRIESNTLKYQMSKEKLSLLLAQIVESMKLGLKKDLTLELYCEESQPDLVVELDRPRMTQVITNIIGNAIKFTEAGSIIVRCRPITEKSCAEIMIKDTGRGIPDEIMPKLFQKFATKGHGGDTQNKGTGLGLYISKAIVTAHNGQISAHNNPEGGATFLITLPISQA